MSARVMPTWRRDAFRLWLIRLIIWMVPLYAAWWWLGGAEWALRILRVLANMTLPDLFPEGVSEIVLQADQSWKVRTGLVIEGSNPLQMGIVLLDKTTLWHFVLGFPLLWALLLATPGRRLERLTWGTLLLSGMSLLAIAGDLWATIAVLINHQPSLIDERLVPPPFRVSGAPYPQWLFHLSSFAHYLGVLIVPIIAPVLIWVTLCPRGVMRLVVSLRQRIGGMNARRSLTRRDRSWGRRRPAD